MRDRWLQLLMTISKISNKQKEQLLRVRPSLDGSMEYRPCKVTLISGDTVDNVYIQEEKSYFKVWGVMPDMDPGKRFVLIEDIIDIEESPNRLEPQLANKLYKGGESGMGYTLFKLVFDTGQTVDVCTGNAIDFVPVPQGLTVANIRDVLPHQGSRQNFERGLDYFWCLYKT